MPLIPPIFNSNSSADPAGSRRGFLRQGTLAALALSLHGRLPAETPPSAPSLVQAFMTEFSVPGMQISFRRGATTLWDGCFGEADRAGHRAVKPDSLFRIASDSKAFTAAAILLLVEDGRMRLQDRIFAPGGVLHQFAVLGLQPEWLNVMTVHQLLTHTCGGWDNSGDDPMFERPGLDHDQLIAWTLRTHPLQHPPGEKYAYSNFGYCLLGRVIERIGGLPYPQFVREHVLRPAGIHDMRIGTHRAAPNEVHYYGQDDGDPYGIPIFRMDSHGGWIATAADLSRFMACLFSPKDQEGALPILKSGSLSVMATGTTANPGYGCGLAVNRVGNAWHSGSLPGTMSLMVHTQNGMSWAAVLNTRSPAEGAALRLDRMLWQIAQSVPDWVA